MVKSAALTDSRDYNASLFKFNKATQCVRSYLHGTPAHGDHFKQGDGLHVLLFAVSSSCSPRAAAAGLGTFALDILGALVCSPPSSLPGLKT